LTPISSHHPYNAIHGGQMSSQDLHNIQECLSSDHRMFVRVAQQMRIEIMQKKKG